MTAFESAIGVIGYINTALWVVAAAAAYQFRKAFSAKARGWTFIMVGAILVVVRSLVKLLPAYDSLEWFYILRYVVGAVAAVFLLIGFYRLYKEAEA